MTIRASPSAAARFAALQELDVLSGETVPQLDRIMALALDICGAAVASFTVHDPTRSIQVSTTFGERQVIARETCICSIVLDAGERVLLDDARADPRTAKMAHVVNPPFLRSYLGAPVGFSADAPFGVLSIAHQDAGRFGTADAARLERLTELVVAFLEARRASVLAARAASKTEAERKRQMQFELIFNTIHEGVNLYASTGEAVEANEAALEILGLTRDEMMGRVFMDPRWRTIRADGSDFPADEYPIARTLKTGQSVRDTDMGVHLPSGDVRWISINADPLRYAENGEVEHAVVTFKDVTRQREAEEHLKAETEKLVEALEAAESASRAKSDFLGVMSHELRTPMNAVLGCATLLSDTQLDGTQRRTLGVLKDAGRQMLALLNDLFDMTSLNAQKVRVDREPVSLVRLIEDATVIWASEVRAKGLSLSVMIDPALIAPRNVDPARLLQIIGNLMANAIKFTASGGVTIQAWPVLGRAGESRVEIEVSDTGPGVPREAADRIFSAFEQADVSTTRRHGGLGLGLHVARRLAIAMGGDVQLDTQLDEGARFTVRIDAPLATAEAVDTVETTGMDGVLAAREVLCVDDNPRNLYVLSAMLRAAGHTPTECGSGAQALVLLAARKFDVVLLDMVMPEVDGLDVLARLREVEGPNARTPVIACTANVLPHQIEAYLAAGTTGVLAKPIDVRALLEAVASAK